MTKTPPALLLTGATGYVGRRLAAGLLGWKVLRASRTADEALGLAPGPHSNRNLA